MFKPLGLLTLVFFLSLPALAGVHRYPNKLFHLSWFLETPSYQFVFENELGQQINYMPNLHVLSRPGISLNGLVGVSWGFKTGFTEEQVFEFGDTKYEDWRLWYAFSQFMIGVHYSQFSGFFIENTAFVNPTFNDVTDPHYQLPDMYVRTLGVNFTWVFSPDKFSLPGLVDQTERQDGGGGSWLLGGAIGQTTFHNDSAIIPATVAAQFPGAADLMEGEFTTYQIKGGYGYSIGNKWFLGGALMIGFGGQLRTLKYTSQVENKGTAATQRVELIIGGGYNGDLFYAALRSMYVQETIPADNFNIDPSFVNGGFVLGFHL